MVTVASMSDPITNLLELSNQKLRAEASRQEPHYRRLLGHIAVHDLTRQAYYTSLAPTPLQLEAKPTPTTPSAPPSQPTQPPSTRPDVAPRPQTPTQTASPSLDGKFSTFSAALAAQIATMEDIIAASKTLRIECNANGDGEEDNEFDDYDSYDYDESEYHLDDPEYHFEEDHDRALWDGGLYDDRHEELLATIAGYAETSEEDVEGEEVDSDSQTECGSDASSLTDVDDYGDVLDYEPSVEGAQGGNDSSATDGLFERLLKEVKTLNLTTPKQGVRDAQIILMPSRGSLQADKGAVVRMVHS